MTQVDDLSRSLIAFEQNSTMVVVLEMSQSSWLAAGVFAIRERSRRPRKKAHDKSYCINLPTSDAFAWFGKGGKC